MRSFLLFALVFAALASWTEAQRPIFSPPERPATPPDKPAGPKKPSDKPKAGTPDKPATPEKHGTEAASDDPVTALISRLSHWPAPKAREAAMVLAGLGAQAKARLLSGLSDNDWRIQAGSAFALAEMGEKDAVGPLKLAIADPSNRAGLAELMQALVKLDADAGTAAIVPFIAHQSARVRQAARDALPATIPAKHLNEIIVMWRNPRGAVRATALELLQRIEGGMEREEWFTSLSDPEPAVGLTAARVLARSKLPGRAERLLNVAGTAPMRPACYAILSLVLLEDLDGVARVEEGGVIAKRAGVLLRGEDGFYRGTAAILFSNLSYRSEDPELRKLADQVLVPMLLGTVAGGVYFSDYSAVEELCWRKLELLTGQKFGPDAPAWKEWWSTAENGFVARRELRRLAADDLVKCRLILTRTAADGRIEQIAMSGATEDLVEGGSEAPFVLGASAREELSKVLDACRFFEARGDADDSSRTEPFLRIGITIPAASMQYQRLHYGAVPDALRPLVAFFEKARRDLAWQRFVSGAGAEEKTKSLQAEDAFFASHEEPELRAAHVRELALRAWPKSGVGVKRLAVAVFAEAPEAWRVANREALSDLLAREKGLTEEAAELVALVSGAGDKGVRDAVLELVAPVETRRGSEVLRNFIAKEPQPSVVALMTDARPRVRAAAAENLVRFKGEPEVVNLLVVGLNDFEAPVRDACLKSLAAMRDDRVLAMIETVLKGEDPALRLRGIQALGAVGGDQAVPRLMEIWRDGDRRVRFTVIHSLKDAGGRRALVALTSIARETGEIDLRKDAIDSLVAVGGPDAATELQEILEKTPEPELKVLALGGLAQVLGVRAAAIVAPFADHDDKMVSRIAILTLARIGAKEALPRLLRLLEASVEGDLAAERALENLVFRCPTNPSPPRRLDEHKLWAERHASEDRSEWFQLAAKECGVPLDESTDWLAGPTLDGPRLRALVVLLEKGNRALRLFADSRLRAVTGRDLPELSALALPAEVEERLTQWKTILAEMKVK